MRSMVAAVACAVSLVATAAVVHAQSAPRFTLSGVVVVDGGGRAWLQEPQLTQNQAVSVRLGESVGPYRLTKILDDRVELTGPAGPIVVLLAGATGPATAATAPTPAARPSFVVPSTPAEGDMEVRRAPLGPPLAPLPPNTPRVDFESLLRGLPAAAPPAPAKR